MEHSLTLWIIFNIFIVAMLIVDLMVFNRNEHEITIKESLIWTGVWIFLACVFGVGIYFYMDPASSLDYFTGYLIEKSLSVDNIFVFILVFSYFGVPAKYQHKVLFWGIFGALVLRFLFIFLGVALIERFEWIVYIFGAFLVYTGIKMAFEMEKEVHPERNPLLKLTRKFIPVTNKFDGPHFLTRVDGKLMATPLFVVLIVIETTDVVFAIDSIPAILAITTDEFLVYSSNAFAILGLRALYFALNGVMKLFHYLHYGLAAILSFVGIKMLIAEFYHVPTPWALGFVGSALIASIAASIFFPKEDKEMPKAPEEE
ncbi:MAG: TerC family protein [Gracilimonas sp.]|uniref:TerC family protein n=1 Tax=Gracilimonas sp. TaxID=1974203 RepID=UPI001B2A6C52|nr:TerC family protein [Gracilimonas sp.]MBO6585962.1 TerC family protein [Gracilimonas sp.]MBO6616959.1 TerC family protein [Gracilimonas sp.]